MPAYPRTKRGSGRRTSTQVHTHFVDARSSFIEGFSSYCSTRFAFIDNAKSVEIHFSHVSQKYSPLLFLDAVNTSAVEFPDHHTNLSSSTSFPSRAIREDGSVIKKMTGEKAIKTFI